MQFTKKELEEQKAKVSDMQESIAREIRRVQEIMATVEAAKARVGQMQVELMVEERILERMGSGDGDEE